MTTPATKPESRLATRLEWPMLGLALLVIPAIAIENANVGSSWHEAAVALNWIIWIAFIAEFVALVVTAPRRWQWLKMHPLDLAIIILTPPFSPAQAARVFRLLRLLRLVRVAKLGRSVFSLEGAKWSALIAFLIIEAGGVGLVIIEGRLHNPHLRITDGLWWAASTVTTVGYGDISPVTIGGRLIAIGIMVVGLGTVAILTGAVAQTVITRQTERAQEASTDEILVAVHSLHAEMATSSPATRRHRVEDGPHTNRPHARAAISPTNFNDQGR